MPVFNNKRKVSRDSTNQPLGRVTKNWGVYIGIIKDNADVQRTGRLQVWIPEFGGIPTDKNIWKTVNYCSPFAGVTPSKDIKPDYANYDSTQTSYGWWAIPPDLENSVAVMFVNGDPARGIWFGCFYEHFLNQMVPGIASSTSTYGTKNVPVGKKVPVSEYNKNVPGKVILDSTVRPVHTPITEAIAKQGLINDGIRGVNTSSARREAPSRVFGVSTPGPKNPGKSNRLGGNQFVMDDGDGTEYIGLKTRSGSYIRLDETNGLIYIINKKGTAWLQLDEEGNVDLFAAKSLSLRAMEDINLRADRNLNIEAGNDINIQASKSWLGGSISDPMGGQGGNINIQANNDLSVLVKGNNTQRTMKNHALTVDANQFITVLGNQDVSVTMNQKTKAGMNYDLSVGMSAKQKSGTDFNIFSTSVFTQGVTGVYVNGGSSLIMSASAVSVNGPPAPPAQQATDATTAQAPSEIPLVQKTNILSTFSDLFTRNKQSVKSIVSRFITFEPCPEHKNKG